MNRNWAATYPVSVVRESVRRLRCGKFVNHASERASLKTYGLPAPETFVIASGVIELVGGCL
jgi:hypothetical protein